MVECRTHKTIAKGIIERKKLNLLKKMFCKVSVDFFSVMDLVVFCKNTGN